MENLSVALVSRNSLAREGLRRILNEDAFSVVQIYSHSDMLLEFSASDVTPNIILIDEQDWEVVSWAVERLHQNFAQSKIVVLVEAFDFDEMVEAFKSGVSGYIVKKIDCNSLLESLRLVALGEKVMPSQLADLLPQRVGGSAMPAIKNDDLNELLSEREIETMRHLLMGCPNKVIAGNLDISEATVKVHVKAILRKLRVQNRTQAAIWAVNHGIDLVAKHPIVESEAPKRAYS